MTTSKQAMPNDQQHQHRPKNTANWDSINRLNSTFHFEWHTPFEKLIEREKISTEKKKKRKRDAWGKEKDDNPSKKQRREQTPAGESGKNKWKTLIHNGLSFARPYTTHLIPLKYNGKSIILPPACEEVASLYSQAKEESRQVPWFKESFFVTSKKYWISIWRGRIRYGN